MMKLYDQLADWYTLLTPLAGYVEEAGHYRAALVGALGPGRHTLLELGAGAGHNAHYLGADFDLTLTDVSPRMLELARATCPEATVTLGDMRTLRLGRTFDAVFLHDAVSYICSEGDLRAVFETARAHLRPGGAFLVAPDYVSETFAPGTEEGGSDAEGRSMRYLEWVWQRAGETDRYVVDYAILTRIGEGATEVHHDRHEEGLFPRATWFKLMEGAGFAVERIAWHHEDIERELEMFLGRAR